MSDQRKMERREFLAAGAAAAALAGFGPPGVVAARPLEGLWVAVDDDTGVTRLRAAGARVFPAAGGAGAAVAAGECALGVTRIPASAAGIYGYERARRRVDTVENLLLGAAVPIARSLSDVFRLDGVLRGEAIPNLSAPRELDGTRIVVPRGVSGTEAVTARLARIGATVGDVDLREASRPELEHRVFRAGSDVLVLPIDRTDPELAEVLAWYPVVRLPVGVLLVGASDDSRAVTTVAAAWTNHGEV